jgi:DNA modification methylase
MYAGKKDALNIQKRDIFENFKCYKLSPPELMRMDNHLLNRHLNFSCVNEMFNIIVTDPPYKMTSRCSSGSTGGMLKKEICKKGKVFSNNDIKPIEYIPEFYRVLKSDAHCYIMTNHINLIEILNVATNCGFHFVKSLIWDKGNKIMGRYYMSQFEYILFFRKGYDKPINDFGTSDILRIPNKKMNNKEIEAAPY